MEDWLNRIGLTLQFIALFLVTPQIVGEQAIERTAKSLADRGRKFDIWFPDWRFHGVRPFPIIGLTWLASFWLFGGMSFASREWGPFPPWFDAIYGVIAAAFAGASIVMALIIAPGFTAWFLHLVADNTHRLLWFGAVTFTLGYTLLILATLHPGHQ
jgi:hypothetical protein